MPLNKLKYTKDWRNPDDFPTYSSDETQIRADMQLLFDEVCAALNKLIDDLDASEIPFDPTPEIQASDVRRALIAIQNQTAQIALGILPDNSISSQKIKPRAITEEKNADGAVVTRVLADESVTEPKLGGASVSTRAIKDGAVTREKMSRGAYDDKANLVNGRVVAEELTRAVKYVVESYTLVLDDLRKIVAVNPTEPVTVTIPGNVDVAFPAGAEIDILSRSSNKITIQGGSGVTVVGPISMLSNPGDRARLVKIGTNEWSISVDGKVPANGIDDSAVTGAKISNGAVTAGKLATGAVTRTKLAGDALHSPVKYLNAGNASYTITADDDGKTLTTNLLAGNFEISLAKSADLPIGMEIAIYWLFAASLKIVTSGGVAVKIPGEELLVDKTFSVPEKNTMIALKKMTTTSGYDYWSLLGNVEVEA